MKKSTILLIICLLLSTLACTTQGISLEVVQTATIDPTATFSVSSNWPTKTPTSITISEPTQASTTVPTLEPAPTSIPPQVEGWTSANLERICIVLEQSALGCEEQRIEPIDVVLGIRNVMDEVEIKVSGLWGSVDESMCDAFLYITLAGKTYKGNYKMSGQSYSCWAGAQVTGKMVLSAEGRPDIEVGIDETRDAPDYLYSCPESACTDGNFSAFNFIGVRLGKIMPEIWGMTEQEFKAANPD